MLKAVFDKGYQQHGGYQEFPGITLDFHVDLRMQRIHPVTVHIHIIPDHNQFFPELYRWLTGRVGVPYLARPTFRFEQQAVLAGAVGLAAAFPPFSQLFLEETLAGPNRAGAIAWLVAVLSGAYAVGSMVGALAASHLRRWRPPAVAATCFCLAGALTASAALLPIRPSSALPLSKLVTSCNS